MNIYINTTSRKRIGAKGMITSEAVV